MPNKRSDVKGETMERCERCEKFFDIKQDQGDYVYYRSENDQIAHTFCNECCEVTDYGEYKKIEEPSNA